METETVKLFGKGYRWEDIPHLWKFIDWLMPLPEELEQKFDQEIEEFEGEKQMSYVVSWERRARREGMLEATRNALLDVLETKFNQVPEDIAKVIPLITDPAQLKALLKTAVQVSSLDEFRPAIEPYTAPPLTPTEQQN